jgi:hypothetical protein
MTPAAIIRGAAAGGVSLALSPASTIKAAGDQGAVNRWLLILREHKPDILAALAAPAADLCPGPPGLRAGSRRLCRRAPSPTMPRLS